MAEMMTAEARAAVLEAVQSTGQIAKNYSARGRVSMPIYIEEWELIAGAALVAISSPAPATEEGDDRDG